MKITIKRAILAAVICLLFTACTNRNESYDEYMKKYGLEAEKLSEAFPSIHGLKEKILAVCRLEESKPVGEKTLYSYSSETLKNYIPACKTIEEIYIYSGPVSIVYQAKDGKTITLLYEEDPIGIVVVDQKNKNAVQWIDGINQNYNLSDKPRYY